MPAHGFLKRLIRVIIDGVFNHTGRDFFAFKDLRQNQQDSPYAAWYVVTSWDDPSTPEDEFDHEGWWGYKPLPVFADNEDGSDLHPGPRQYILDATARWMDPNADGNPADGIDGWRLDVANEVPLGFWAEAPCSRTTGSVYVASTRRCAFDLLVADDSLHTLAFRRTLDDEAVVVVINRSDASQRLRLPMATEGATFEAVFSTTDDTVGVTMEL